MVSGTEGTSLYLKTNTSLLDQSPGTSVDVLEPVRTKVYSSIPSRDYDYRVTHIHQLYNIVENTTESEGEIKHKINSNE